MECSLEKGDLLRLEIGPKGVVLHSLKGTIWLTKGDGSDYLIYPGRSFKLRAGVSAVVEGLGSAEFRLEAVPGAEAGIGPTLSFARRQPVF